MSIIQTKILSIVLFFAFIFLSGFWLSRSGKPYSILIFTIHKLIGLAAGVFLIVTVYRTYQVALFNTIQITVLVVTVLIFVGLVAAGGLLSIEAEGGLSDTSQSMLAAISMIHKTFPYFAVLSTAATLYLILIRKM